MHSRGAACVQTVVRFAGEHHITSAYLAGGNQLKMAWIPDHLERVLYNWKMHIGYSAERGRNIMPTKYLVARDPERYGAINSDALLRDRWPWMMKVRSSFRYVGSSVCADVHLGGIVRSSMS